MANLFGSLARRSTLDSLTSNKSDAISIYALEELSELVRKSDEKTVQDIATYLCANRLENKSPVVKLKALKAIKHVANKTGCLSFKMAVQQHSGKLREAVNFRCDADALRGTKPAEAVREAAKEAIHSIFSTESHLDNRQLEGFGSAGRSPAKLEPAGAISNSNSSTFHFQKPTFPSSRGGRRDEQLSSPGSPQIMSPVPLGKHFAGTTFAGNAKPIGDLLDSICAQKGVRVQPTANEVKSFISAAQDADISNLQGELVGRLSGGQWQQKFRALCLLQALLECQNKQFRSTVREAFTSSSSAVEQLSGESHQNLAQKASRVLQLLTGKHGAVSAGGQQSFPAPPQSTRASGDLLDFGLSNMGQGGNGQAQAPATATTSSLFDGLEFAQSDNAGVAPTTTPAAAPAQQAQGQMEGAANLFDGLDVGGNTIAGGTQVSGQQQQQNNGLDLVNAALEQAAPISPPAFGMGAMGQPQQNFMGNAFVPMQQQQQAVPPPAPFHPGNMNPAYTGQQMPMAGGGMGMGMGMGMGNMGMAPMMQQQPMQAPMGYGGAQAFNMMPQYQGMAPMMQQPQSGYMMPPQQQQPQLGGGSSLLSPQRSMSPGLTKKEPAFDFVQDHIQNLKGAKK